MAWSYTCSFHGPNAVAAVVTTNPSGGPPDVVPATISCPLCVAAGRGHTLVRVGP